MVRNRLKYFTVLNTARSFRGWKRINHETMSLLPIFCSWHLKVRASLVSRGKYLVYCVHSSHLSSLVLPTFHLSLLWLSIFLCHSFLPLLYVKKFWVNAFQKMLLQGNNHEEISVLLITTHPQGLSSSVSTKSIKCSSEMGFVCRREQQTDCLVGEGDPRRQD
jgi:hypothetical protein